MSTAANSPGHMLKLISRREVADRTLAFEFDKPSWFVFKAGQFAEISWVDPPETDAEGNTRAFSIASAPHEEHLVFATRLRDTAFKRVLQKTPIGTVVRLEGPFGDLTLHNNVRRPAILMAGGIGITPFRSVIRRAAHEKLPHQVFLFYANRRPQDAPFLEELSAIERENANFTFVPTMTAVGRLQREWTGETGRFSAEMLTRHMKKIASPEFNVAGPIYYVAGPPAMVKGVRAMLNDAGIDDDDVRTEEFGGY
ncbi:MAG: FAD-dependent oxidoreductase [Bryobacteraceae bacterium]